MKLTFLGTGTSIGVPAIGCQCEVCRSTEARDKRLRQSAYLETDGGIRVLIDCGPDFRQQTTRFPFTKIDAVVISHIHFDHVAGIDDLRPFCMFGDVDIYCQDDVVRGLHQTMPYCFKENLYPGVPHLNLHTIEPHESFIVSRSKEVVAQFPPSGASLSGVINKVGRTIVVPPAEGSLEITPIRVMHGKMPILGFIFRETPSQPPRGEEIESHTFLAANQQGIESSPFKGDKRGSTPHYSSLAYITDMKSIDEVECEYLHDIDILVVNALRFEKPHHSHQLVDDAIAFSRRIGAKRTYLIHLTHDIGTHDIANSRLPEGFEFAYDGEVIMTKD